MSFRLDHHEATSQGIRRIALEGLDAAVAQLQDHGSDHNQAVHDARKRLKELRALLRLVRGSLGKANYKRENRCFRDAGRRLAAARDAQVLRSTFDALRKQAEGIPGEALERISATLAARHGAALDEDAVAEVVPVLKAARERITTLSIQKDGWTALEGGLSEVYRRGRRSLAKAAKHPSDETFHDWRKQVKYLWHGLQVLEPLWPEVLERSAEESHKLADLLGDDHDLAVLEQTLRGEPESFTDGATLEALSTLIAARRYYLQAEAKRLGARLYAEKPRAFVRRHEKYWRAWQELPGVRSQ
ncbi:MAG: CHAD domain-containing protein [Deinococcota bacterium]|nr:CHAD domain-containing protein [Deinococcota bacterium]